MMKRMMKAPLIAAAAVTLVLAMGTKAHATVLAPGTSGLPADYAAIAATAGVQIAYMATPYSVTMLGVTNAGTFYTAVYRNTLGTLDFYYQITNSGNTPIQSVDGSSYDGFLTDVYQYISTTVAALPKGFVAPTAGNTATANSNRTGDGVTVSFVFIPPDSSKTQPGESSPIGVIRTDATAFGPGIASIADGVDVNLLGWAPAVPEPSSIALLGLGLLGLAGAARRRRS